MFPVFWHINSRAAMSIFILISWCIYVELLKGKYPDMKYLDFMHTYNFMTTVSYNF